MHPAGLRFSRRRFLGASTASALGAGAMGCRPPAHAAEAAGGKPGAQGAEVTLFLCGDVMLGRGIDQILPHPVDPVLREPYVASALGYVTLAERAHGPIPRGVAPDYVWGDALGMLREVRPDARIINLETSITDSPDFWPKVVNYRMAPRNAEVLTAADIDCCALANNHVLDFGRQGLVETLQTLDRIGVAGAGAGLDREAAAAPAILERPAGGRVLVFGYGSTSSGIPPEWAAGPDEPGVNLLPDLSHATLARVLAHALETSRPGDLLIASIHWGGNWGYEIPEAQVRFARGLIDGGFDVVHGHSSHHVKALEVYRDRPILYGCGDFITDYEGISGHEEFRGDLAVAYLPRFFASGGLAEFRLVPFRMRRFRLERVPRSDAVWLRDLLEREGRRFDTGVTLRDDGSLAVVPA